MELQVAQNPGSYWGVLGTVEVLGRTLLCGVGWIMAHSLEVLIVVFPYLRDV
jgi:hypothetical protein